MGVSRSAVGGIGLIVTQDVVEALVKLGLIEANNEGEYETDVIEWELLNLDIGYVKAFGEYDGPYFTALMVKGNNLDELIPNAAKFLSDIEVKLGLKYSFKDLEVISEIYEC